MREPVGLLEVLRGQQHRGAVVDELADELPDTDPALGVEAGGRLVEEQHRRPVHERRREVEASAHAPRVGARRPVGGVDEVEALEQVGRARRDAGAGEMRELCHHAKVLAPGEVVVDGCVLAGETDAGSNRGRVSHHVDAEHASPARVGPHGRGEHPDGGGLAGAVGAEQPEHGSGGHCEVDSVERDHVAEVLAQALDDDGRGGSSVVHPVTLAQMLEWSQVSNVTDC